MTQKKYKLRVITTACAIAIASLSGISAAKSPNEQSTATMSSPNSAKMSKAEIAATKHVDDAVAVVHKMEANHEIRPILKQAKGILIVPSYGRAALGIGGSGGAAVLLVKKDNGSWSDPAFYNIGGISLGAQVGAETGPIAMILNNDKAVNSFMQKNNFSLSAEAGLTIVNWTAIAEGTAGAGDVVAWAGTKGLFGNVASVGVNDIRFNQTETDAYYSRKGANQVSARDVISGKIASNPQADTLRHALAATTNSMSSGSSATPMLERSGRGSETMKNDK